MSVIVGHGWIRRDAEPPRHALASTQARFAPSDGSLGADHSVHQTSLRPSKYGETQGTYAQTLQQLFVEGRLSRRFGHGIA